MEIYREVSGENTERKFYRYCALLVILSFFAWEAYQTSQGKVSFLGWSYSVIFLGLWIWRCVFKYTYILTDSEFIVLSHGLGFTRKYSNKLERTESYTNKYIKSFFKKTKLRHYIHRYSSVDGEQMRLIVFNENGSLRGVLFKVSDRFIKELKKKMPDKFLPLE